MSQALRKAVFSITLLLAVHAMGEDRPAPLRVCLVSGSHEYESDASLERFQRYIEARHDAACTLLRAPDMDSLPGLEALESTDVALFFTRRLRIGGADLERVKKYCASGRPIVALRTASHGFQNWLEFDALVLGGNYRGHFEAGETLEAKVAPGAERHPILEGVGPLRTLASLYETAPLAPDAELLLSGSTPVAGPQPLAWTRLRGGGRTFYTSLGAQQDFENGSFLRMLANAVFWAAGRAPESEAPPLPAARPKPAGSVVLPLRARRQLSTGGGGWQEVRFWREVAASEVAILICDMWDKHWCSGATGRCDALAARMGPLLRAARAKGVAVIHAPSETMPFYAGYPQRERMIRARTIALPALLDMSDPPLPIDDSDGGCDTEEKPWYMAWTRQNPRIEIGDLDGISDSGEEVYRFLREEGITNLIVMGVHTNMCVLGRSFGIRNMTRLGIRCVLVRDLTDTMYDPRDPPHVTHDGGTDLVVKHIEAYWAPSIAAAELEGALH
jgi:nicotinamidase-related amidase/type 1 glutamine amidotransferase